MISSSPRKSKDSPFDWMKKSFCVLGIIAMFYAPSAHAQFGGICIDPVTEAETTESVVIENATWIQQIMEWIDDHLDKVKDQLEKRIIAEKEKAIANGNTNALIDNQRAVATAQDAARLSATATQPDTSIACALAAIHNNRNIQRDITRGIDQARFQLYLQQGSNSQGAQTSRMTQTAIKVCQRTGAQFSFENAPLPALQARGWAANCKAGTDSQ